MKINFKNPKIQRIILIILIVLIPIIILFTISYNSSLATLDLLIAPKSSTIKINDKIYQNGEYKLKPGTYTVEISKKNFFTKTFTLNLKSNKTTKLHTYLEQTDGSYSWYLNHPEDDFIRTQIGDEEATKESEQYKKDYPIITVLPLIHAEYDDQYNYTEYRIDGGNFEECEKEFCLKITDTTGGNEENAKNLIRKNGYNPEKYEIIYDYVPIEPLE